MGGFYDERSETKKATAKMGGLYEERSETKKQGSCIGRGRPQLRWEDCMMRDLRQRNKEVV